MATGNSGETAQDKAKGNGSEQDKAEARGSAPAKAGDGKSDSLATMAAYQVMIEAAPSIARKIKTASTGTALSILLVDSLDVMSSGIPFVQMSSQFQFWQEELKTRFDSVDKCVKEIETAAKPPTKAFAITDIKDAFDAAGTVIKTIADVVGYFRIDYEMQGQNVNPSAVAFQALMANSLAMEKCSVYLPAFHRLSQTPALITQLDDLINKKNALRQRLERLKALLAGFKDVVTATGKKEAIEAACKAADNCISQFIEFNKYILSVPQDGGHSPLASAVIGQYLKDKNVTHLLYLSVIGAAGEAIVGKGQLREGTASFVGGCVVSYIFADCEGKIVCAGTEYGSACATVKLGHVKSPEFDKEIKTTPGLIKRGLVGITNALWSRSEEVDRVAKPTRPSDPAAK